VPADTAALQYEPASGLGELESTSDLGISSSGLVIWSILPVTVTVQAPGTLGTAREAFKSITI
jgi:hypothetical protein